MVLISAILSLIATAVGIAAALRQFFRPRLRLHFGTLGMEEDRHGFKRRRRKATLIYGVLPSDEDYHFFPIAIGVHNTSSVPISALRLHIEYPASCLLDDSAVTDRNGDTHRFGKAAVKGRVATRIAELAQVVFEQDTLHPKEKLILNEVVRVPKKVIPGMSRDDRGRSILARRWSDVPDFFAAFAVHVWVSAANCNRVALVGVVAIVEACEEPRLTDAANVLLRRCWDGRRMKRGVVGWAARYKRFFTDYAELVFLPHDSLVRKPEIGIDSTVLRDATTALLEFNRPPWRPTEESYDVWWLESAPPNSR